MAMDMSYAENDDVGDERRRRGSKRRCPDSETTSILKF